MLELYGHPVVDGADHIDIPFLLFRVEDGPELIAVLTLLVLRMHPWVVGYVCRPVLLFTDGKRSVTTIKIACD